MAQKAAIGIFIMLIIFGGLGIFLYLYFKTNTFKNEGDSCEPTDKEIIENTDKTTYKLSNSKACIPTTCVSGYTFSTASNTCVVSSSSSSTSDSNSNSSSSDTPSDSDTPAAYEPPAGEVCIGSPVPAAAEFRQDLKTKECKLSKCNPNYKISSDGKSCVYDESVRGGVIAYDCEYQFMGDNTHYCLNDKEAGLRWDWASGSSKAYCNSQIDYYDVEFSSEWNPEIKFRTKVPGGTSQVGIKGLPTEFMKKTVSFSVMPYDKQGNPMFRERRYFTLFRDRDKESCSAVGGTISDAYYNWNEDDNIIKMTWTMGNGNMGSIRIVDASGTSYDSGDQYVDTVRTLYVPEGSLVRYWCQYGHDKDILWSELSNYAPSISSSHSCWAGNTKPGVGKVDGDAPIKFKSTVSKAPATASIQSQSQSSKK